MIFSKVLFFIAVCTARVQERPGQKNDKYQAAGILIRVGSRFDRALVIWDFRGFWDFPFGKRDRKDDHYPIETAIREAREEIGASEQNLLKHLGVLANPVVIYDKTSVLYIAKYDQNLYSEMGLRHDRKITHGGREGNKWEIPKIESILDGSFERKYGKVRDIAKYFLRQARKQGKL